MSAAPSSANTSRDPLEPAVLIEGAQTDQSLNDSLLHHVWRGAGRGWWMLFGCALFGAGLLLIAITYTLLQGIGSWATTTRRLGLRHHQLRVVDRLGHAGTLISAILLLLQQKWRTSINRSPRHDALSRSSARCSSAAAHGTPLVRHVLAHALPERPGHLAAVQEPAHLGRLRRLDLLHDLVALLVPRPHPRPRVAARLLEEQDEAPRLRNLRHGWRGSGRHWAEYKWSYLLLAGLSTPLVLSVQH